MENGKREVIKLQTAPKSDRRRPLLREKCSLSIKIQLPGARETQCSGLGVARSFARYRLKGEGKDTSFPPNSPLWSFSWTHIIFNFLIPGKELLSLEALLVTRPFQGSLAQWHSINLFKIVKLKTAFFKLPPDNILPQQHEG